MFKLTIRKRLPNTRRTLALLERARREAAEASNDEAIALTCERIRRGVRPDGTSQPPLAASTVARKGHARPLYHTGLLSRASEWQRTRGAQSVGSRPPGNRAHLIGYLAQDGYLVFQDADPEVAAMAERTFADRVARIDLRAAVDTGVVR